VNDNVLCGDVWRKSSYSADQGNCVEITRRSPWVMGVRDSMDMRGPRLFFTVDEWKMFTCHVKSIDSGER
jgi:hypothetical protein